MNNNQTPLGIGMILFGAIFLPIPFFSMFYFWIYAGLVVSFLLFTIFVDIQGKGRKAENLKAYAGYACLLLMALFFSMPAIKLFHDNPIIQFLILLAGVLIIGVAYKYRCLIEGALFGKNEKLRIYGYIFYGFVVVIITAGGGGFYKVPEYFSNVYGHKATMSYFSIILLLFSYWLYIFATSLTCRFSRFKKS